MMYLLALGGFVLLFAGGEWLVRGAVSVSRRMGVSPLLIGMTIVAFCTSAPELLVSLEAALRGQVDMAVGNVVGSNVANVLLIIGLSALISPIVVKPAELRRDVLVMLGSSALLAGLAMRGGIERWQGGLMVGALIAYVWYSYWAEIYRDSPGAELHSHEAEEFNAVTSRLWLGLVELGAGLAALVLGSRLLVTGAGEIARSFGVPEAVIGLTLVALGTSLPELATSVMAAARGHADVAVGNVVGSNLFNSLGIIAITALVSPLTVSEAIASFDIWVMLTSAIVLTVFLLWRSRIGRLAGGVLLATYVVYIGVLYTGF
ncbi:MAG: calcium/sodium antiporter [Anaerosomatales bacterium]|nr:calcium/sodium antiporter [Anaerosomatales bacterium]MDT8434236.1 calcium/sodium antiporter [Anaerosomatales bacterium]